ncbi:Uncharacterised protein family (UPF0227) [Psychroflexus salarius]|uniref:Uncharacterized protein family (UPF0227) n=1 Tax=Psychroflexus salarius TaxID=1155689 RepID=A0A1M4X4L3_9FLAO|nr:YqiA/YcfP family alpha/beta fold hydrolase [Psychroflexus salarius]SHE88416.1 Uncharacterised protein family (UPF0227) [Psychroflexus salarius]
MAEETKDILLFKKGSDVIVITFGGIKMGIGMPRFEFKNILIKYNCDQAFIIDPNQSWYQDGINSKPNFESLKSEIENIIRDYKKVIFIGNSMGGFAAIMFGALLNVDRVISFSPQTFISRYRRAYYGDKRWSDQINSIVSKNYLNLKRLLLKTKSKNSTIYSIYYSTTDKLDKIHSERLSKLKSCNLYSYSFGGHNLVKSLKDKGILTEILNENLL